MVLVAAGKLEDARAAAEKGLAVLDRMSDEDLERRGLAREHLRGKLR